MESQEEKIIKAFGEKVREYREKAGLSQSDLGAKIDSDYRKIQRIENGENATSIVTAVEIAKVLGFSLDNIVF